MNSGPCPKRCPLRCAIARRCSPGLHCVATGCTVLQHAVRRCNVLHCVATKRTAVRSLRCSCFLLSTRTASCTRTAARARSTATPVAPQRCLVLPLVGPLAPLARRRTVRSRSFIPAAAVVAVAPRSAAISTSLTSSASAVLTRQPRRWHVLHYVANMPGHLVCCACVGMHPTAIGCGAKTCTTTSAKVPR